MRVIVQRYGKLGCASHDETGASVVFENVLEPRFKLTQARGVAIRLVGEFKNALCTRADAEFILQRVLPGVVTVQSAVAQLPHPLVFRKGLLGSQRQVQVEIAIRIIVRAADFRLDVSQHGIDVGLTQRATECRHHYREAQCRPAMGDHGFPGRHRFATVEQGVGKVGRHDAETLDQRRLDIGLPVAAVATDAMGRIDRAAAGELVGRRRSGHAELQAKAECEPLSKHVHGLEPP